MYKIILPNFEGPLDLLIYFIKRYEINIYDIPIAKITNEFLNYIRLMQILDIEISSEFILMASTLMEIKAKMLLPNKNEQNFKEDEDPRKELVDKLIEYQVIKELSNELKLNFIKNQNLFFRGLFESEITELSKQLKTFKPLGLVDLANAFYALFVQHKPEDKGQIIPKETLSIQEEINRIQNILKRKKYIVFPKLIQSKEKRYVIITFLALLELVKSKKAYLYQCDFDTEILVFSSDFIAKN
ncbi:MAG: segregation/condensation protein A [Ignavibacteria bacterium]|nr:segregation/condensation protein A [Ignavibacteria bacterium]